MIIYMKLNTKNRIILNFKFLHNHNSILFSISRYTLKLRGAFLHCNVIKSKLKSNKVELKEEKRNCQFISNNTNN